MRVELTNIQSIRSAVYDLEEKGITQIIGENSNGKSILIKSMSFVANSGIIHRDERETIINDNASMGIIQMDRNGLSLKVVISRDDYNSRYELTRKNGEIISRSIREGGLDKLSEEFGWVTFDGNVCLQIFETFGIMPFVNNRVSCDYDIIDSIITDKVANNFVENYSKVTHPAFKNQVSNLKSTIDSCTRILDGITFYDINSYEDILYKLKSFQRNISRLIMYTPKRLPITEALKYVDLKPIVFTRLPVYKVLPPVPNINSLYKEIKEYSEAINGVCPTCGYGFKNRGVLIDEV